MEPMGSAFVDTFEGPNVEFNLDGLLAHVWSIPGTRVAPSRISDSRGNGLDLSST